MFNIIETKFTKIKTKFNKIETKFYYNYCRYGLIR